MTYDGNSWSPRCSNLELMTDSVSVYRGRHCSVRSSRDRSSFFLFENIIIRISHNKFSGLSLELSDREKSGLFGSIQGEVLVLILDFPICPIHLNFSISSKQGEVSKIRETSSPELPSRMSIGFATGCVFQFRFFFCVFYSLAWFFISCWAKSIK